LIKDKNRNMGERRNIESWLKTKPLACNQMTTLEKRLKKKTAQ
jgi:hypothetical protein